MSWRSLPGPSAVGVDLLDVPRFRGMLLRRPGLAARLFSPSELAYAWRFSDPAPRLAARFAAKEAALKALGVGLGAVAFHDLEVGRLDSGLPVLRTGGRAAVLAEEQGVTSWSLSLTHTDHLAAAVVVAHRAVAHRAVADGVVAHGVAAQGEPGADVEGGVCDIPPPGTRCNFTHTSLPPGPGPQ